MFRLSEPELAAIDRNHTRLKKIPDRRQTIDMFAAAGEEELTLLGERISPTTTPETTTTTTPQLCLSL